VNLYDIARAKRELERAVTSRHPDTIARTAMTNIWPLYTGHFEALIAAVSALPSAVLKRYPALRVVHPLTPVLARTTRPFKPLLSPDQARTMGPDELDLVTLAQMVAFRFSGDVAAAIIYAQRLEDRILQIKIESRERTDGPLWYYHFSIGSTRLAAGDSSRALLELATARQLGALSAQPYAERLSLGRTALAHAIRGSLDDSAAALTEAAQLPSASNAHRGASSSTEHAAATLISVEQMAPEAEEMLGRLEPHDTIDFTWPFALLARTRWLLAQHRPSEALETALFARDTHPTQHGSIATDVIDAASIEAMWAVGDVTTARRIVDAQLKPGAFTQFAMVRLALHESRLELASSELQRLETGAPLSPGHRREWRLLSAWLEALRSDSVSAGGAQRLLRPALVTNNRRLFASLPRQLIEMMTDELSAEQTEALEQALGGVTHIESERRPVLTQSETRVLNAMLTHPTTAAIAASLHVSPNTIKSQLKSLYRKLGCNSRADAITIGARFRLITRDAD